MAGLQPRPCEKDHPEGVAYAFALANSKSAVETPPASFAAPAQAFLAELVFVCSGNDRAQALQSEFLLAQRPGGAGRALRRLLSLSKGVQAGAGIADRPLRRLLSLSKGRLSKEAQAGRSESL